jgi:hypothetical protein
MSQQEAETNFFQKHASRILFNEEELRDRQERRFCRVYEEYMSMIELKKKINGLKYASDISYDKLPSKVQEQFK